MTDTIQQLKPKNGGVKTQSGKDISKYNALRHGVLRGTLLKNETVEAEQIQNYFIDEYQPFNLIERLLIETMTIAYIRLLRALRAEQDYLTGITEPPEYERTEIIAPIGVPDILSEGIYKSTLVKGHEVQMIPEKVEELDKLYSRYIVSCERQFYRSLHELQRIQAIRAGIRPTSMAVDVLNDKTD